MGPLYQVSRTVGGEVRLHTISDGEFCSCFRLVYQIQRQASARLREHFTQPVLAQAVAAQAAADDEDDSEEQQAHGNFAL